MRLRLERTPILLAAVLAASLFLRWPMGSLDLQHYIGPDEGEMVENTLEMLKTGYLHHRHPGYPGLFFYIQLAPAASHYFLAAARGEGRTVPEIPREGFYRVARQTTLLAGFVAALVIYFVGARWYGRGPAALASALLGLSPLVFRESGSVSPDLMLMLFVAIGLGLSLRILDDPSPSRFVLAGVGVGLAAAIKYTGAVLIAPLLAAWLLSRDPMRRIGAAALGLGASLLTFMLASPYTWLDLPNSLRGVTMHVGYYQAAQENTLWELSRFVATAGVGIPAAIAALGGSAWVLSRRERTGVVLLCFPLGYFLLFSLFQRAYPRHALVLLPSFALLAARAVMSFLERRNRLRWAPYAVVSILLAPLAFTSVRLGMAARRTTPAIRAAAWIDENLPTGSRILEDQFTPRLDPERYRVHRARVEEQVFVGNYDWVLHSGYPPGLPVSGLRRVVRFPPEGSLGAAITVYQVPERETLMGVTLGSDEREAILGAGDLPFFGQGWHPPSPGAFETSRLSDGPISEIFFVLEAEDRGASLGAEIRAASAAPEGDTVRVGIELNGKPVAALDVGGDEPVDYPLPLPGTFLQEGLNCLRLRYPQTVRLDRRHREAALRLFHIKLSRH